MQRRHRVFERRPTYGNQRRRMVSLLLLLVLLLFLMRYAANPKHYGWLDDEPTVAAAAAQAVKPPQGDAAAAGPASGQASPPGNAVGQPPRPESEPAEGTDEDPEELDAAREEFQAVSDRTLFLQAEEMPAYDRLLRWTARQPFEAMLKRAQRDVVFNDLIQSPDRYRGKLIALDLNVRRMIKYPEAPNPKPLYADLYEAWGFTTESKAWLYEVVTFQPPAGMPIGTNISEKVVAVGYFYKLQAYHQAGAKPNDQPLVAPLLIGRIHWDRPEPIRLERTDWAWLGGVIGLFGVIAIAVLGWAFLRPRNPAPRVLTRSRGGISTDQWLEQAETGEVPPEGNIPDDPDEHQDS